MAKYLFALLISSVYLSAVLSEQPHFFSVFTEATSVTSYFLSLLFLYSLACVFSQADILIHMKPEKN